MRSAIVLHGSCDREEYFSDDYPSLSNSHWLPWLQKQFLMQGMQAFTPEMPRAYAPEYSIWKSEFERYPVSEESILVGHSCGGGFLLRWLSESKCRVCRLILVAPWLDPAGRKCSEFFSFTIDPALAERMETHLFESMNDEQDIRDSIAIIRAALPGLHYHAFDNYGHFCFDDMGTTRFPELSVVALGQTRGGR